MTITIFGAGLAGLIAARMLNERAPTICEKQEALPNNHHAVLRFRSSVVGDATNIPFRKVRVIKAVHGGINPVADANNYSRKVTGGELHSRSISSLEPVERWIAPPDLVGRLAATAKIDYGVDFQDWSHNLIRGDRRDSPVISTIPVNIMMGLFNWPDLPEFKYSSGWTLKAKLPETTDVHCTVYYPGAVPWYRASITGSELMVEGSGNLAPKLNSTINSLLPTLAASLGLDSEMMPGLEWQLKEARYQKIVELDNFGKESVKRFIMWLSKEHSIYSLGRFATWRPKLLLDDIVEDVRVISRLIDGETFYGT